MDNITIVFYSIIYEAYDPPKKHCRAVIDNPGHHLISFEKPNWTKLFDQIEKYYPGIEIDIPDDIETITYDKDFKEIV